MLFKSTKKIQISVLKTYKKEVLDFLQDLEIFSGTSIFIDEKTLLKKDFLLVKNGLKKSDSFKGLEKLIWSLDSTISFLSDFEKNGLVFFSKNQKFLIEDIKKTAATYNYLEAIETCRGFIGEMKFNKTNNLKSKIELYSKENLMNLKKCHEYFLWQMDQKKVDDLGWDTDRMFIFQGFIIEDKFDFLQKGLEKIARDGFFIEEIECDLDIFKNKKAPVFIRDFGFFNVFNVFIILYIFLTGRDYFVPLKRKVAYFGLKNK